MKLTEIVLTAPRDEHNEEYVRHFVNAPVVATVPGTKYVLKRVKDEYGDIKYGVFDESQTMLISYLSLDVQPDGTAVVSLPSTMPEYRNQGLMVFLYGYAVNKDGFTLMSDYQQTPQARKLWKSLNRHHFFNIDVVNTRTQERQHWTGYNTPWRGADKDVRLVATRFTNEQTQLTEQYSCQRGPRAERRKLGMDNPELYGPECHKIFANSKDIHQ